MKNKALAFSRQGNIGIITLNRPGSGNAITRQITSELSEIRKEITYGSEISVLILTGAGHEAFSTGTDADEYNTIRDREELLKNFSASGIIGSFNRPVIAAINGRAFGQGLELALACDLRISSDKAKFSMDQINKAELPFDGGTQRLPRLIGRGKALEMIFCGEIINAEEALEIGLINRIVPEEDLMPEALKIAGSMAEKGPIALRYAKEAIYKGMDLTLNQGLLLEADLYFLLHTTKDRTEGITAFREKRKPRFEGK